MKPKIFGGRVVTGSSFVHLIEIVLKAFNTKKVPDLEKGLQIILKTETQKTVNKIKQKINQHLKKNLLNFENITKFLIKFYKQNFQDLKQIYGKQQIHEIFVKMFEHVDKQILAQFSHEEQENDLRDLLNKLANNKQAPMKKQF